MTQDQGSSAPVRRRSWWRICPRDAAVSSYARDYYLVLKSEFASIDPNMLPVEDRAFKDYLALIAETDRLLDENSPRLTIQKVFQVEMALLRILPEDTLRTKVWSARSAYRKLVGEAIYQEYLSSKPPDPRKDAVAAVRADIVNLVKGTHWWYVNALVMERGLKDFKLTLFRWLVGGLIVMVLLLALLIGGHGVLFAGEDHRLYFRVLGIGFLVIYAGTLGAIISTARRISLYVRAPMSDTDPVIRMLGMENGQTGLRLSIICGGVFALVLYLLFAAGLGADIFNEKLVPAFLKAPSSAAEACDLRQQLGATFYGLLPADSASLARLLIWSFIAGFGEKFVPDILDRLSAKGTADRRAGTRPAGPVANAGDGDDASGKGRPAS